MIKPTNSFGGGQTDNVHHSLTARSVSRSFREGLRNHNQLKPQTHLEPLTDENSRYPHQDTNNSHRDTSSPEHLGIPSSPASIPTRSHYAYPPTGDTSDDSMSSVMAPRKSPRKRNVNGHSTKVNSNNNNLKNEQYII